MQHLSLRISFLVTLLGFFFSIGAGYSHAAKAVEKEIIAVLDLQGLGTQPLLPVAASDRLREELLNSGYFTLVSRNTLDKVMDELALNQVTCVEKDCALKLGRITGARIILTGKIIRIENAVWQVSAEFTDVETSETLRAGSIIYRGDTVGLIEDGIPDLVKKLIPGGDPSVFGSVVNFLMQKTSSLFQPEQTEKDESGDKSAEPEPQPEPQQQPEPALKETTGYRIWGSPSAFIFDFENSDNNSLETFEGEGISVAVEREFDKSWAIGAALHSGSLTDQTAGFGATSPQSISGDYTVLTLSVMDSVPNGKPWFYYGTGLIYASVDINEGGTSGSDSLIGTLLMLRAAYNFDSGLFLGFDFQGSFLFVSSSGTRHDELRQAGAGSPKAGAGVAGFIVGYSF